MKYLFLILMAISSLLGACGTVQKTPSGQLQVNTAVVRADVQKSVPYIRPISAGACVGVIFGVDPKDRVGIANDVYAVASVVDVLATGVAPTPDQLGNAILVGTDKSEDYLMIAQALESVWSSVYPQIKGDPALAINVIGQLAAGARDAAGAFATLPKNLPTPTPTP